jgi:hypothetical protein
MKHFLEFALTNFMLTVLVIGLVGSGIALLRASKPLTTAVLSPSWAKRKAQEHDRILKEHPFDDMAGIRARLTRELRDAGHSPQAASQMACQRYPLPLAPG